MKQKKYAVIFLVLIVVMGVITGCGQKNDDTEIQTTQQNAQEETVEEAEEEETEEEETEAEDSDTELTPLNYALTYETNELAGILKLAQEQGYLEEELKAVGYELNILGFAQAGPAINEAIASGAVDIANYGNLPATVAKSNGVGVSIVGISDNQSNFSVIVKSDSGIETVKDLEGKKVIVGKGTIAEQYWDRLVEEYEIDTDKIEIINDVASASSTFLTGSADAWVNSSLYEFVLAKQEPVTSIETTITNHPDWAGETVFAVRDSFKEEHPEVVTAFLTAYIRGYNYALEHEEETYQSLVSEVLSYDSAKLTYEQVDPLFSNFDAEITESEVERYEALNEFLLEKELISTSVAPEEIFDTTFYEEAKKNVEAAN